MNKEIDIIIASYGDPAVMPSNLRLCLDSIEAFTVVPYNIILERSFKSASENRNNGLKRSKASIICFLDDDTWVTPNWHKEPLELLDTNENFVVGSIIKLETGKLFNCGIKFEPPLAFIPGEYGKLQNDANSEIEVAAIPTTAMFFKRSIVGDTRFDVGFTDCQWEDLDFFLKLKNNGGIAVMATSSIVYHEHMFRGKNFDNNYTLFKNKWKLKLLDFYPEKFTTYFSSFLDCFVHDDLGKSDFKLIKKKDNGVSVYEQNEQVFICKLSSKENAEISKEFNVISSLLLGSENIPQIVYEFKRDKALLGFAIPYYECNKKFENIDAIATALARVHAKNWRFVYPNKLVDLTVLIGGHSFWVGGQEILRQQLKSNQIITEENKLRVMKCIDKMEHFSSLFSALFDLTECSIIHGDLTRENIRHTEQQVVFIDWGEACVGPIANDLIRFFVESRADNSYQTEFLKEYINEFESVTGHLFAVEKILQQMKYLEPLVHLELLILGERNDNALWIEEIGEIEKHIEALTAEQVEYKL